MILARCCQTDQVNRDRMGGYVALMGESEMHADFWRGNLKERECMET
jgi:hypothetical protein